MTSSNIEQLRIDIELLRVKNKELKASVRGLPPIAANRSHAVRCALIILKALVNTGTAYPEAHRRVSEAFMMTVRESEQLTVAYAADSKNVTQSPVR